MRADGRRGLLDRQLGERGADALLILASSSRDPDLAPFTGAVHLGTSLLVAPRGGEPHLGFFTPMERGEAATTGLALLDPDALEIPRWGEEGLEPPEFLAAATGRALELAGLSPPGRIALAGHGPAGTVHAACTRLARAGWTFLPGNDLSLLLRKPKSPADLAGIRTAARGATAAVRAVATLLAHATAHDGELWLEGERLRVARLRTEVARVLADPALDGSLEQPEGNILAPAEEGALPHSIGTDERVLRTGESLVVDLFPRGRLFADITRTFCVGPPPESLARAHEAVVAALERAHRNAVPGARGYDLHQEVCDHLEAAGYQTSTSHPDTTTGYVHGLGHGVGYQLHEYPSFRKRTGEEGLLARGDVFTLEPGLYDPDAGWGVRLEDLVHLPESHAGDASPENFTPLPYDLDPRAWV